MATGPLRDYGQDRATGAEIFEHLLGKHDFRSRTGRFHEQQEIGFLLKGEGLEVGAHGNEIHTIAEPKILDKLLMGGVQGRLKGYSDGPFPSPVRPNLCEGSEKILRRSSTKKGPGIADQTVLDRECRLGIIRRVKAIGNDGNAGAPTNRSQVLSNGFRHRNHGIRGLDNEAFEPEVDPATQATAGRAEVRILRPAIPEICHPG
jgi:hypothetical protein